MSKMSIAYAMKKKAQKHADGGPVLPQADTVQESMRKAFGSSKKHAEGGEICPSCGGSGPKMMAHGGMAEEKASGYLAMPKEHEVMNKDAMEEDDMVSRIMAKKMSKGGQVANDTHPFEAEFETPNEFDDLVLDDNLESHYGDDDNSGDMLGNKQEDEDRKDIVSRIMASRKKKDKNPRPA